MILTDFHLHTSFSSDSDTPMEEMIQRAISLGLQTLCFTEHFDYDFPENPEGLDFLLDFDKYYDAFLYYKEKYRGQIELLQGIEVGVQPHLKKELAAFYEKYGKRYDFLLASCHVIRRMDPYEPAYFSAYPGQEGMCLYLETLLQNMDVWTDYQSLAHLDYAYRYYPNPRPPFCYADYEDLLDSILKKLIRSRKALEVNTAGWRAGLPWPNPHIDILRRYRELGGSLLTIGSDAHKPADVASSFSRLSDLLQGLGFQYYTVYKNQQPFTVPLGR